MLFFLVGPRLDIRCGLSFETSYSFYSQALALKEDLASSTGRDQEKPLVVACVAGDWDGVDRAGMP